METVSTDEVPAVERLAFWHEMSSKMWVPIETRCEPHLGSAFRAQAGFNGLGLVQATLLTATPHSIHRTPKLIRRADPGARPRAVLHPDGWHDMHLHARVRGA